MKNKLILGAAFLLAAITESLACTNLIVGKGASVDGSVIVSYSADSYGMFGELYHYPAGMHEKLARMITITSISILTVKHLQYALMRVTLSLRKNNVCSKSR